MVCFCRDTAHKNWKSMIGELPSLIQAAKESRTLEQRMLSRCKITGWSEVAITFCDPETSILLHLLDSCSTLPETPPFSEL